MKLHKSNFGIAICWPVGLKTLFVCGWLGMIFVESKFSIVFFLYRKEITTVDGINIIKIAVK